MSWIWLISAGLLEIGFASCLKLSEEFTKPLYTIGFLVLGTISFYCLTKAMQDIPIGTAYAVWTGIGAAGVAIFGMVFFGEAISLLRIFFLCTLVGSIVALKFVTPA